MGMFEPLTVIGLGRSPYDEAVTGTGPRPQSFRNQEYDDRGRPINNASREAVRGIIRSHNEVMQVIGAAELDSGVNNSEIDVRTQYYAYQAAMGYSVGLAGCIAIDAGLWGLNGLRDRMLVWRGYGHNPLRELVQGSHLEPGHPVMKLLVTGFPTMAAFKLLRSNWLQLPASSSLSHMSLRRRHPWALNLWMWFGIHTQLYVLFQRIGIISGYRLPHPLFYIPWSSMSPIASPGLPSDFRAISIAKWTGSVLLSVVPLATFVALTNLESVVQEFLSETLEAVLPTPDSNDIHSRRSFWECLSSLFPNFSNLSFFASSDQYDRDRSRRSQAPEPYSANDLPSPEILEPVIVEAPEPQLAENTTATAATTAATTATTTAATTTATTTTATTAATTTTPPADETSRPPLTTLASSSTSLPNTSPEMSFDPPSATVDDYGSEEDDADLMTGPLLSFDVETSDPTDAPMGTGPWSAELRATPPSESRGYAAPPKYLVTLLSTSPQTMAVRIICNLVSRITMLPVEMCAVRFLAQSYLAASPALAATVAAGGNVPGAVNLVKDVSWATVVNIINLDLSHFIIMVDVWAVIVLASRYLHYSLKEWRELPTEYTEGWYDPDFAA